MSIVQQQHQNAVHPSVEVHADAGQHDDNGTGILMWISHHSREIVMGALVAGGILAGIFALSVSKTPIKQQFEGVAISNDAPTPSGGGVTGIQRQPSN
ncbi:MAG: hypothetical protein ABW095_16585 [Candidatus Thiodiazotropha sp.]